MPLREATLSWFVGYADADAFGTVQWSRYAEWAARANSLLWKENRADPPDAGVVRSCEIEYLAPAAFEDTLTVRARYTAAGRTSFAAEIDFEQQDGTTVAVATLRLISVDPETGKPVPIPEWLHVLREG